MTQIKINGEMITDAGMIATIVHETRTRVTVKVISLFFPRHEWHGELVQVDKGRQKYLRYLIIGQHHKFWKTGPRANYEVGGERYVSDWDYAA